MQANMSAVHLSRREYGCQLRQQPTCIQCSGLWILRHRFHSFKQVAAGQNYSSVAHWHRNMLCKSLPRRRRA